MPAKPEQKPFDFDDLMYSLENAAEFLRNEEWPPPAKPEQTLMEAILAVLNDGYDIAHLADHSDLPSLRLVNDFRAKLDALGALYEAAKPRPELRRTTCGKAPEYIEEDHGTTICCPDPECECDFLHETTPERAVHVWNEDWRPNNERPHGRLGTLERRLRGAFLSEIT